MAPANDDIQLSHRSATLNRIINGLTETLHHPLVIPSSNKLTSVLAHPLPQFGIAQDTSYHLSQRLAISLWHHKAIYTMLHEPTCRCTDRIGGDHQQTLVHRLVDYQTPGFFSGWYPDRG